MKSTFFGMVPVLVLQSVYLIVNVNSTTETTYLAISQQTIKIPCDCNTTFATFDFFAIGSFNDLHLWLTSFYIRIPRYTGNFSGVRLTGFVKDWELVSNFMRKLWWPISFRLCYICSGSNAIPICNLCILMQDFFLQPQRIGVPYPTSNSISRSVRFLRSCPRVHRWRWMVTLTRRVEAGFASVNFPMYTGPMLARKPGFI